MGIGDILAQLRDDPGFLDRFRFDPSSALAGFKLTPEERSRLDRLSQAIDGLDIAADLKDALGKLMGSTPAGIATTPAGTTPAATPGQLVTPHTGRDDRPTGAAALTLPSIPHASAAKPADPLGAMTTGEPPRIRWRPGPDPGPEADDEPPPPDDPPTPKPGPGDGDVPQPPDPVYPPHDEPHPPQPPPPDQPSPPHTTRTGHGPPASLKPPGPGRDPAREPTTPTAPRLNVHLGPDPSTVVAGGEAHNVFAHGPPHIGPGGRPPQALDALVGRVRATAGPERRAALHELLGHLVR